MAGRTGRRVGVELLQTGFAQASAEAREARQQAEAMQRADEARRQRSVLARLRRAWRGE